MFLGALALAGWLSGTATAQNASTPKALKPDLRAGGAQPSLIPNGQVTQVTVPGFHLAHSQVEVKGVCKLLGYKIVSDNQIQMTLQGVRRIDDKEDGCFFTVRNASGSASSYVVVDLTDAEKRQQTDRQITEDQNRVRDFVAQAGKKWDVHFADGGAETYVAQGASPDGMPMFQANDGRSVKIMVRPDHSLVLIDDSCLRTGRLVDGKVTAGQSMPGCTHFGAWTASVTP